MDWIHQKAIPNQKMATGNKEISKNRKSEMKSQLPKLNRIKATGTEIILIEKLVAIVDFDIEKITKY